MAGTMTRTEATPAVSTSTPRFGKTLFALAAVICVVALLLSLVVSDALRTSMSASAGPLKPGASVHVGLVGMVQEEVTVWSVRPVTAGPVTAELNLCVGERGGGAVGSVSGSEDLNEFCTSVEPLRRGTVLSPQPPAGDSENYVIATITQTGPGRGAFCGIDIAYRSGWRPGWQWRAGSADHVSNAKDPSISDALCPREP